MVERWSPKPKVVGSSPIAPAYKVVMLSVLCKFSNNVIREWRNISWVSGKRSLLLLLVIVMCIIMLSSFFSFVDFVSFAFINFVIG